MAAFTAGDLLVYRVGSGTGSLVNTGNPVFLDEYSPTGTLVQSLALPTVASGAQHALFASGTASSEGLLTLSADGQHLVLTGYSLEPGTSLSATTSAADARTIGSVDYTGTIDTTTALTDFNSANNPRSATSVDGSGFYIDGGSGGVRYATLGATTSSSVSTTTANLRDISIFGGQLYVSSSSGSLRIGTVGTGVSNATGQTTTPLTGVPVSTGTTPVNSPYQFFLAHLGPTGTAPDTLYIADDTAGGGEVEKFSLVSGTWTANGVVADTAVRGLTGSVNGNAVTLYTTTGGSTATGGGSLDTFTDTSGFNQTINGTLVHLASAAANEAFRGVAFAPVAPPIAPSLSVSNVSMLEGNSGTTPFVFTITRAGDPTGAVTFTASTVDGTATAGSDYTALSQTLTIAAGATTATFTVAVNGDTMVEPDETFTVHLTNVTGAAAPTADGVGTIVNDDTVAPGPIPGGPQAQTYAITAAGAYTLAAGQTFTETGAAPAITATDTATAATSVDIEGALVGAAAQRGLIETVPNGQLTVGAAGSIHTTDADAFQFVQPAGGGGHANVANLGSIVSASTIGRPNTAGTGTTAHGYALNFNAATGGAGVTDHVSGGTIANGSTTNATALIESDSDDAIRLGSNQTLTNYGKVVGAGPVDDSASNNNLKQGGSTTNVYDSSRGVEINGHAHDTVDNYGRIEGAQHGVDAGDVADTDITVINEAGGVIIGHNGSGVGSDGATANDINATDVTVTNSGSIYGEYHPTYDRSGAATTDGDGDGVDIDGAGTVVNNAGAIIAGAGAGEVLNGQGAGGFDSNGRANHSEGLSLGGGVVHNYGTISGADYGITVNNDGDTNRSGVADTTILNEAGATIIGQNGYAIRLENKGADSLDTDSITNHGTITGNGAIPVATGTATIEGGGADMNTVGTLNGVTYTAGAGDTNRFVSGDGAAIQTGEGNDVVVNDGVITGNDGRAISLEGGDDTLTLYAAGTVTGTIDGGAGADTLNLTTGTTGATANTLTGVVNFETLNVQKGAWTLTDAESYITAVVSAGATLQLGTGGTTGTLTAAVTDSGTLTVDHSDTVTLGATVAAGGAGLLSQIGAGVTKLAGASGFAGATLAAGVLDVAATGATAAVTFAPTGGATPLLRVETAATTAGDFASTIKGFAAGDTLDVTDVGTGATATLGANNVLTVTGAAGTRTLHLDPAQSFAGQTFAAAADVGGTGVNLTLATAPATSGVLYSQTFDSYTASGLNPGGTGGALDSNVFRISGLNGPTTSNYGDTSTAADYSRGLLAVTADPSTAGLYSGVTANSGAGDHALLIQPTGAEFDVNGFVEMRVQNTTANVVTGLSLAFNWVYHNNEPRADDLALAYSTDGVNFTVVPSANLNTPAAASTASPVPFTYTQENVTLPAGTAVAPGAYVYFRFEHVASTGSGSRDEVGIDNVAVSYAGVSHTPVLSVSNVSANEGDSGTTPFTFTVTRAGDLTGATTVHYATADGTANAGSDYTAVAGDLAFAPGESTKIVTVQVIGDTVQEPNETFTLNLSNAVNASLPTTPATGTIVNDDVSVTSIGAVQGAATTSPFVGQTVTTTGVVTAIKTGSGGGYYIQDPTNAGPVGASHGLFVFTAATPTVAVGDAVTVQGVVTEYAAQTNDRPTTELNSPVTTVTSHGNAVTPVVIGAGGLLPPTSTIAGPTYDPVHNGVDFYESLEGQLVTIHNAQATDATYSGSTWVVADLGAEATGINARGGITSSAGDFDPERIQVYSTALNATMGEHLGDITGVISYYGGEYELIPTTPVTPPGNSAAAPPALPLETTTLKGDATHLSIAAYNVENLGPVEPGVAQATVDARFAALGSDIANNLGGPAIVGLEEIQDGNGENPNTPPAANDPNYAADYATYQTSLSASVTLTKLEGAISAAGGPAYSYVEIPPTTTNTNGGAPDGNIRPAILYDPTKVGYVAGSAHLIADPNLSDGDAFANSRMPLAAQFTFNGQTINVIEIHDYARSGSEELFGQDQPPVNSGDQRRIDQTSAVKAYVSQLLAADPNAKIVVQGDFNGFQFETTLTQLAHSGGGQLNQLSDLLPANERYSTTFEGISQEIDHALVSDSIDAGAQFDIVHLNTGQTAANQASDHDPIVSLLSVPGVVAGNTPVTAVNATPAQTITDKATATPFAGVTVVDPDTGQTETATITYAAASGTLAGTGLTGSAGAYTLSAVSAAALQGALQALVFTPTMNQTTPGQTVQTAFAVSVSDGASNSSTSDTVTVTSVNDAPSFTGTHASTTPDRTSDALFSGVTVTDPDTPASGGDGDHQLRRGERDADRRGRRHGGQRRGDLHAPGGLRPGADDGAPGGRLHARYGCAGRGEHLHHRQPDGERRHGVHGPRHGHGGHGHPSRRHPAGARRRARLGERPGGRLGWARAHADGHRPGRGGHGDLGAGDGRGGLHRGRHADRLRPAHGRDGGLQCGHRHVDSDGLGVGRRLRLGPGARRLQPRRHGGGGRAHGELHHRRRPGRGLPAGDRDGRRGRLHPAHYGRRNGRRDDQPGSDQPGRPAGLHDAVRRSLARGPRRPGLHHADEPPLRPGAGGEGNRRPAR